MSASNMPTDPTPGFRQAEVSWVHVSPYTGKLDRVPLDKSQRLGLILIST